MSRRRSKLSAAAVLTAALLLTSPAALAAGYTQWAPNGIPVVPTATNKYTPQACVSDNGAIVVWAEGAPTPVLRAARLNPDGSVAWSGDVAPTGGAGQTDPQICPDGANGAYVVWEDGRRGGSDVFVQRLSSAGIRLWGDGGILVNGGAAGTYHLECRVLQDGLDGCIISWNDNSDGGRPYARKYRNNGIAEWGAMRLCTSASGLNPVDTVVLTNDGAGGAVFAWPDYRNGNEDIYANRVDSAGTLFTGDGEVICTQTSMQFQPRIIFSTMGGAIITWTDTRNGRNDIYGQRVDADFTRYWGTNGMPVCVNERNKDSVQLASDLLGGALLTWRDNPVLGDLRAQRLDVNGVTRWASEGVSICTGNFSKYAPRIVNDFIGGAIVCWYDNRSGEHAVYAQKLDAAGNLVDVANGQALSDPTLPLSSAPALCTDYVGGATAAWIRADQHLMAQRIDYTYDYYFAEGNTRTGFAEYICLGNPTEDTVSAAVIAIFNDGTAPVGQALTVDPNSRTTIYIPTLAGSANAEKDVSVRIMASRPLICERPMYFNYGGSWTGGSDAMAATSPSETWYFAEGATLPGFEEWICVYNPTGTVATLTFDFQGDTAFAVREGYVQPYSRNSFRVNELLGEGWQASLMLASSEPVVAERSMYFNYLGMAGSLNWTGGTCVMGATQLNRAYYFAEGTTRFASNALFEEWLTLQNPSLTTSITVNASYQLESGAPVNKSYTVPAQRRLTVFVPAEVGFQHDVSVKLTSDADFLAERPMYFDYLGPAGDRDWTGGSCVMGGAAPGTAWYFGEGATIAGFHEYLCLQNPSASDSTVTITYYPQGAAPISRPGIVVPANSRFTVFVNDNAGSGLQLSAGVQVTAGPEIVVERPMYFDYGGWTGGHDILGGYLFKPDVP